MVKTRARGTSNQSSPFSVTTAEGVVDPVDQIIQDAVARRSAGGVRSRGSGAESYGTPEGSYDPRDEAFFQAMSPEEQNAYIAQLDDEIYDPRDELFYDVMSPEERARIDRLRQPSLQQASDERLAQSQADIQERYDLRERDIAARNRRIEDAGVQAFYERPTGPMTRADGYDTSKVQLPEGASRADEREAQTEGFVDAYVRRRQAGAPKFSTYDPKVYGLDPKFAKQREEVASNLEAKRLELEQMRDTDRLVKAREAKEKAASNLRNAEKMIEEYKPTDRGPMSTTGSKVAAAIAIALGEAARGFRGGQGRNVGMDLINQAIDREAKRQQDEYNRLKDRADFANNIYARAFQEFGSAEAAFETAKSALWNRAFQTAETQLSAIRGNQAADEFLKKALNNKEIQKARTRDAHNAAAAQASGSRGVSDKMKETAYLRGSKSKGLVTKFDKARKTLGKVKSRGYVNDLKKIFAAADKDGAALALAGAAAKADPDFRALIDFYNDINAIAFGQAAEDQAASSISNKDVEIFRNLLANPIVSDKQIEGYLTYLQDKASQNAVFNDLLVNGASNPEAAQLADQYMVQELGYKQRRDRSFYKDDGFDYNATSQFASSLPKYRVTQSPRATGPQQTPMSSLGPF